MNIFLSYSWKNDNIANSLDNLFETKNIELIRDSKNLEYKKSIKEFMKTIRKSDYCLIVISKFYLESINCMYEILEFIKDENFKERILPLVQEDTNIFHQVGRNEYLKYWQNEFNKVDKSQSELDPLNRTETIKELKKIKNIQDNLDEFLSIISDMKCIVFSEEISEYHFNEIYNSIYPDTNYIKSIATIYNDHISKQEEDNLLTPIPNSVLHSEIDFSIDLKCENENSMFVFALKKAIEKNPQMKESQQYHYKMTKTAYGYNFLLYYQKNKDILKAHSVMVNLDKKCNVIFVSLEPTVTTFIFKQIDYIKIATIIGDNHELTIYKYGDDVKFKASNGAISKNYKKLEIEKIISIFEKAYSGNLINERINNELNITSKYYSDDDWFLLFDFKNKQGNWPEEANVWIPKKEFKTFIKYLR